jgi:hypothetical protein
VNEPESHGYIRYRIQALAGVQSGTPVNNTAYIYFDFNPAVVTNTTLNTLVDTIPVGLPANISNRRVWLYPNPFNQSATLTYDNPNAELHQLIVSDVTGKQVQAAQNSTSNSMVIERQKLSKGIYFYRLTNTATNDVHIGKFVVN